MWNGATVCCVRPPLPLPVVYSILVHPPTGSQRLRVTAGQDGVGQRGMLRFAPAAGGADRALLLCNAAGSQIRGAGTRNNVAGVEGATAAAATGRRLPPPILRASRPRGRAPPRRRALSAPRRPWPTAKARLCKGRPLRGSAPRPTPLSPSPELAWPRRACTRKTLRRAFEFGRYSQDSPNA